MVIFLIQKIAGRYYDNILRQSEELMKSYSMSVILSVSEKSTIVMAGDSGGGIGTSQSINRINLARDNSRHANRAPIILLIRLSHCANRTHRCSFP